jgi:hypothetical protein
MAQHGLAGLAAVGGFMFASSHLEPCPSMSFDGWVLENLCLLQQDLNHKI